MSSCAKFKEGNFLLSIFFITICVGYVLLLAEGTGEAVALHKTPNLGLVNVVIETGF
jgi:hypothetical protein